MNLFTRTFSKIFKSSNQQELDKLKNYISAINSKEKEFKSLSESDFKEKTAALKQCITRLEERRLRWIKEEESLHIAGLEHKDLGNYEQQILKTNSAMEAIFKSKDS